MSGLYLGVGGHAGVGQIWPGSNAGTAAQVSPQGPTAAAAGFGTVTDGDSGGHDSVSAGFLSVGTISLALLVYIWWSLPR